MQPCRLGQLAPGIPALQASLDDKTPQACKIFICTDVFVVVQKEPIAAREALQGSRGARGKVLGRGRDRRAAESDTNTELLGENTNPVRG